MGVQTLKRAAMLQEWATRIAKYRSGGKTVKAWCAQQGIAIKTYDSVCGRGDAADVPAGFFPDPLSMRIIPGLPRYSNRPDSLNRREYLCAFLERSEIEISNNRVGNAICSIVVGRKNRLFCDTQGCATACTIIFTVPETAKANELNPETYLNHILTILPERFSQNPQAAPWAEDMHRLFRVWIIEHLRWYLYLITYFRC